MLTRKHLKAVRRLNNHPLNMAAMELLPKDWVEPSILRVLTMAQWGAQEERLASDLVLTQVLDLMDADPEVAMRWVTENKEGDEFLHPDALDNVTPEHAAAKVLEAITYRMEY